MSRDLEQQAEDAFGDHVYGCGCWTLTVSRQCLMTNPCKHEVQICGGRRHVLSGPAVMRRFLLMGLCVPCRFLPYLGRALLCCCG